MNLSVLFIPVNLFTIMWQFFLTDCSINGCFSLFFSCSPPIILILIHLTHCDVHLTGGCFVNLFDYSTSLFLILIWSFLVVFWPRSHWPIRSWFLSFAWWFPYLSPRYLHPHAPTSRCPGCCINPWCCEGQLGRQLRSQESEDHGSSVLHSAMENQLFYKC